MCRSASEADHAGTPDEAHVYCDTHGTELYKPYLAIMPKCSDMPECSNLTSIRAYAASDVALQQRLY